MDSPTFRVRMGAVSLARTPAAKSFIGRIKSLVAKHAMGPGGFRRGRLSGCARGGSAPAAIRVRAAPQRVTVKSRVVRHSRYTRSGGAASALHEHIAYLGRGGVTEEGGRGVLFDADSDLSGEEVRAFRERMTDDRHHFRFIV